MTNITIKASTPIEELREAGIVPDWMAEDCKRGIVTEIGRRGTQSLLFHVSAADPRLRFIS